MSRSVDLVDIPRRVLAANMSIRVTVRTSTHDGLSIAYSVLHQLAGHLGCIGFFATHFTSLVDDFASHPEVILKHMKTFVEEETREVTFLYRLTDG